MSGVISKCRKKISIERDELAAMLPMGSFLKQRWFRLLSRKFTVKLLVSLMFVRDVFFPSVSQDFMCRSEWSWNNFQLFSSFFIFGIHKNQLNLLESLFPIGSDVPKALFSFQSSGMEFCFSAMACRRRAKAPARQLSGIACAALMASLGSNLDEKWSGLNGTSLFLMGKSTN